MTDLSARFALPLLQPGQAQKEIFHNEALDRIDVALHPAVMTGALNAAPSAPVPGQAWIVGDSPVGAWTGHAGQIAAWTSGGWRFVAPLPGMLLWIVDLARWAWHDGITWQFGGLPTAGISVGGKPVVGARRAAIADPAGGASPDPVARSTLVSILATLRAHGLIDE